MTYRKQVFLAVLLMASSALAQTLESKASNDPPADDVAKARCAYMQSDPACASAMGNQNAQADRDRTLARMQRPMHGPMGGPPGRGVSYPAQWLPGPSPAHALIGALIGFGFGAAIAAKGHNDAGNILLIGAIGAGIGAGIGLSIPAFPHRYRYGPYYPADEAARRSKWGRGRRKAAGRNLGQPVPTGLPGS
jgi:hypothetical protein